MDETLEQPVAQETPSADEAFAAFDKLLDVRDAEPPAELPDEKDAEPEETAEQAPEAPAAPAAKVDKRTKEGRKASIQAEIDAAVKEREDVRRELAALRAERASAAPKPAPVVAPVTSASDEPDPSDLKKYPDGQFDRQFVKDLGKWAADQTIKAENERRQATETDRMWQAQGQAQMATLREKVGAIEKDTAAYFGALRPELQELAPSGSLTVEGRKFVQTPEGRDLAVRCALMDTAIECDHTKAILDYFNEHDDEFRRFLTLPPKDLFREMGKLDATLGAANLRPGPRPVTSKANPPIKPLGGDASVTDDETLDDQLPIEEFIRRGNRQQLRSRR